MVGFFFSSYMWKTMRLLKVAIGFLDRDLLSLAVGTLGAATFVGYLTRLLDSMLELKRFYDGHQLHWYFYVD